MGHTELPVCPSGSVTELFIIFWLEQALCHVAPLIILGLYGGEVVNGLQSLKEKPTLERFVQRSQVQGTDGN